MQQLIDMLKRIQELLEQVHQITENQRNILMQQDEEETTIAMIEEMAQYKEGLTTQIEEIEKQFEARYTPLKEKIVRTDYGKIMKGYVEIILKLKERVIKLEQQNVILLKDKLTLYGKPMHITPKANHVAAAYNVQKAYKE